MFAVLATMCGKCARTNGARGTKNMECARKGASLGMKYEEPARENAALGAKNRKCARKGAARGSKNEESARKNAALGSKNKECTRKRPRPACGRASRGAKNEEGARKNVAHARKNVESARKIQGDGPLRWRVRYALNVKGSAVYEPTPGRAKPRCKPGDAARSITGDVFATLRPAATMKATVGNSPHH
ncbi:MAG: hypothetical protein IPG92_10920 [Flavobacteriales bacterium]|nr:hypothetical protein [Flavobacteriales bacterium]